MNDNLKEWLAVPILFVIVIMIAVYGAKWFGSPNAPTESSECGSGYLKYDC